MTGLYYAIWTQMPDGRFAKVWMSEPLAPGEVDIDVSNLVLEPEVRHVSPADAALQDLLSRAGGGR